MCEVQVSQKCTKQRQLKLIDGSMACEECERALQREAHRMNLSAQKEPRQEVAALPRTTPFGRME